MLGGLLIADEVVDIFIPVRFYWVRRAVVEIARRKDEGGKDERRKKPPRGIFGHLRFSEMEPVASARATTSGFAMPRRLGSRVKKLANPQAAGSPSPRLPSAARLNESVLVILSPSVSPW